MGFLPCPLPMAMLAIAAGLHNIIHGMVLMADALLDLVRRGIVTPEEAFAKCMDKMSLVTLFKGAGIELPTP